jgi:hypothetical protein
MMYILILFLSYSLSCTHTRTCMGLLFLYFKTMTSDIKSFSVPFPSVDLPACIYLHAYLTTLSVARNIGRRIIRCLNNELEKIWIKLRVRWTEEKDEESQLGQLYVDWDINSGPSEYEAGMLFLRLRLLAWDLIEKLILAQLVKEFPIFYEMWKFITVFVRGRDKRIKLN